MNFRLIITTTDDCEQQGRQRLHIKCENVLRNHELRLYQTYKEYSRVVHVITWTRKNLCHTMQIIVMP